jgi:hypothetical protein
VNKLLPEQREKLLCQTTQVDREEGVGAKYETYFVHVNIPNTIISNFVSNKTGLYVSIYISSECQCVTSISKLLGKRKRRSKSQTTSSTAASLPGDVYTQAAFTAFDALDGIQSKSKKTPDIGVAWNWSICMQQGYLQIKGEWLMQRQESATM